MKQLTNNKTTINKEVNYSPVIAMEIKTLDDTLTFYIIQLKTNCLINRMHYKKNI
jgi:hypothetical protein